MPPVHVSVLGAGAWGTALAALASRQANTLLWARAPQVADGIGRTRRNPRYLSDIALPEALAATADLGAALRHVLDAPTPALIVLGVPMAGLSGICQRLADGLPAHRDNPLHLLWTCKGIDPDTLQFP